MVGYRYGRVQISKCFGFKNLIIFKIQFLEFWQMVVVDDMGFFGLWLICGIKFFFIIFDYSKSGDKCYQDILMREGLCVVMEKLERVVLKKVFVYFFLI